MKRNSIAILCGLVCGILFYFYGIVNFFTVLFLSVLFGILSYIFKFKFSQNVIIIIFFLGIFTLSIRNTESGFVDGENVSIKATVLSKNNSRNFKKYEISVFSVDKKEFKEKIILYTQIDLHIGDVIKFDGKINHIYGNTNPRLFNFKNYYLKDKIFSRVFSDDVKTIGKSNNTFLKFKNLFQNFVENTFDKYLKNENSAIMKRIFLGNNYDFEFEDTVRDLSFSHILAISGLHIGIIYLIFNFLFSFIPISRILREILIITILFLYCNLIGNPSSAIRATVYLSIIFLSKNFSRVTDNVNSLILTLIIILFINPFEIFDVGLYLSVLSVLGILVIYPRFRTKKDGLFITSLKISFSVIVMIIPVILLTFGEFSFISFIANLIVVPFFVLSIVLGFGLLIFEIIGLFIPYIIAFLLNAILVLIRLNVDFLSEFNFKFSFYPFDFSMLVIYYLTLIFIFKRIYRYFDLEKLKLIFISSMAILVLTNFYGEYRNMIKINFIDIGQGDSILIRSRRKNILIDTGGVVYGENDNGKDILVPYLKKNGISKLDYVFISHIDADHCKNLNILSRNIKIKNVVFRNGGHREFLNKFGNFKSENVIEISSSGNLDLKDLKFDIFQVLSGLTENEKSLIINLNVNGKKILFTGDIGFFAENQILKYNIKSDYLKVAHHGSESSSGTEFLKENGSEFAIISVGKRNRYGHPNEETLKRLENEKIKIFRTDKGGNIILEIDRYSQKITNFVDIRDSAIKYINFYLEDFFIIVLYLLSYIFILIYYKKYDEYYIKICDKR